MSTIIVCDYPGCQYRAAYQVTLRRHSTWEGEWPRSLDVCLDHLFDVSFDEKAIGEFEAFEASKRTTA